MSRWLRVNIVDYLENVAIVAAGVVAEITRRRIDRLSQMEVTTEAKMGVEETVAENRISCKGSL